jgi:membrane dipeptidase
MNIIDLHCDTLSAITVNRKELFSNSGHFDLVRGLESGIKIQFMAIFAGPQESTAALAEVCRQIEYYENQVHANQEFIYKLLSRQDLDANWTGKGIGGILHLEGAEALGKDKDILEFLFESGLRSMGLTWNNSNLLSGGIGAGKDAGGLSRWGREVVQEMDKMGIILDGAHISERGYFDLLEVYNKPLLVTHANSRTLCPHPRNLSDKQLLALKENGGIIGITQVSDFVKEPGASLEDLLDHIVYIADLIGVKHLALGSDFDGAEDIVMPGVEGYIIWPELLTGRGFTPDEIDMILYRNALKIVSGILR